MPLAAASLVVPAWAIGVGLLANRAAAAGNGLYDLDLFAGTGVLDKVPDVDNAIGAGVGALEAGVVRLYGVVILGGWVRWVRGRLISGDQRRLEASTTSYGPGLCKILQMNFREFPFPEGGWIGRSLHTRYALSANPISGGNRSA